MNRADSALARTAACLALLAPSGLARHNGHDGHDAAPRAQLWRDERNARSYSGELLAATATHVTLALRGGGGLAVTYAGW